MAHTSRLRRAVTTAEPSCIICGCTEDRPCYLQDGDEYSLECCYWVAPNLCSNPACVSTAIAQQESAGGLVLTDSEGANG